MIILTSGFDSRGDQDSAILSEISKFNVLSVKNLI